MDPHEQPNCSYAGYTASVDEVSSNMFHINVITKAFWANGMIIIDCQDCFLHTSALENNIVFAIFHV